MSSRGLLGAVLISSFFLACGSSDRPAKSTDAEDVPPASEPAPDPATDERPAAAQAEESWEGESEATKSDSASDVDGSPKVNSKVEETRTIDVIAKILKDNRKPVRDCYEKALKEIPDLKGDMVIHFQLNPEGKIKKIELNVERSTLKSPVVADCAIAEIKKLTFPPSSRGMDTTVNYPYNLNP
jgi:hypothetical protein